jgi:phenylpropionate dioxygenase-like ring-hydroxylating dioxygenase large terminal subunit
MFDKIGELIKYWHVIALSDELKKGKSLKRNLYQIPLLIWRDEALKVHALLDVCSHKKAPLEVCNFDKNQVLCQYHGWKYNEEGRLIDIPSSQHLVQKMKCKVDAYSIIEQNSFIWIYLDTETENILSPEPLSEVAGENWQHYHTSMVFETNEELLVENFMDATHTPMVHDKLIRDNDKKVKHSITITQTNETVHVSYAETNEKVGLGIDWMLGNNLTVSHTDEFLLPNLVRVNYYINKIHRFQAFIACTPLHNGQTIAFVRLSFQFKWFNYLIKLLIPFFAKKVLKQDFIITQKQFVNQRIFKAKPDNNIDYDAMHNKVKKIRNNKINKVELRKESSTQKINLTL